MNAPVDRRTAVTGLSPAVREVRIRNARNDIFEALKPVSRNAECSLYCLELDDDGCLALHLGRVVDAVNNAARKNRQLRALLSEPTIKRFETSQTNVSDAAVGKMVAALHDAGVEFTNGEQPGVRLRKP